MSALSILALLLCSVAASDADVASEATIEIEYAAALRDQGLIDTKRPSESKILHLISMGDSDPDALSQRIHAKNRKAEYDAFSHWIAACCEDDELLAVTKTERSRPAGPSHSNDVIRPR